jgi:hypothetical protein
MGTGATPNYVVRVPARVSAVPVVTRAFFEATWVAARDWVAERVHIAVP